MSGSGASGGDGPTVVYLAGVARSGSTVVERQLAARTGWLAAGELAAVWRHGTLDDRPCSCGATFRACPFWQEVVARAPVVGDRATAEQVDAAVRRLTTAKEALRLLAPGGAARVLGAVPPVWVDATGSLYRAVADVAGAAVVVDSSKAPAYALALATRAGLSVRVVHLVRDPLAVAGSWSRAVEVPVGVHPPPRRAPVRAALVWDAIEVVTAIAGRRLGGAVPVRYEDVVARPAAELDRVVAALGVPRASGVEDAGYHSMSGNPGVRFDAVAPEIEARPPAALSGRDRLLVDVLTLPVAVVRGYRRPGGAG